MNLETWVSLAALVTAFVLLSRQLTGVKHDLKAELKTEVGRLDDRMDRFDGRMDRLDDRITFVHSDLKGDINRLDDRVYALAVGLREWTETAERRFAPAVARPG